MARHERTEFYRSNRDYGGLLADRERNDEEENEDEYGFRSQSSGRKQAQQDNPANQEYLDRRQRLKELERDKIRGKIPASSRVNGRLPARNGTTSNYASDRKRLPYNK